MLHGHGDILHHVQSRVCRGVRLFLPSLVTVGQGELNVIWVNSKGSVLGLGGCHLILNSNSPEGQSPLNL